MGLPGAVFEAPKRCQNQLEIGSENWFRRPSGGRFLGDFWAPKNPPGGPFCIVFYKDFCFSGCRRRYLQRCISGLQKGVQKWLPKSIKTGAKMGPGRPPEALGGPHRRPLTAPTASIVGPHCVQNSPRMAPTWVPKWAPEGRPRPPKRLHGGLAPSCGLLRAPAGSCAKPVFVVGFGFALVCVFGVGFVLCVCGCCCCCCCSFV